MSRRIPIEICIEWWIIEYADAENDVDTDIKGYFETWQRCRIAIADADIESNIDADVHIDADSESSEWFSVSNCQSYDVYRASKKGHGANQHHLENLHFVFPTYIIYIYITFFLWTDIASIAL